MACIWSTTWLYLAEDSESCSSSRSKSSRSSRKLEGESAGSVASEKLSRRGRAWVASREGLRESAKMSRERLARSAGGTSSRRFLTCCEWRQVSGVSLETCRSTEAFLEPRKLCGFVAGSRVCGKQRLGGSAGSVERSRRLGLPLGGDWPRRACLAASGASRVGSVSSLRESGVPLRVSVFEGFESLCVVLAALVRVVSAEGVGAVFNEGVLFG